MRFRRSLQYAISLTWILLLVVGCGAPGVAPGAVAASSEERISSPDVARGDLRELADGNNAFAFDLYQAISDGEDNLLYSPYSISVALAMTYAGAQGETERQMADTLHFTLPQERLHPAVNALDLEMSRRSRSLQLNIANAIWGQKGYPFLPEYLDVLALNYGAGIQLVDFEKDAAAAVDEINRWVREQTEGRFQDIAHNVSPDTRLLLANAIYFNAKWDLPFEEERTHDEPFYLLDGRKETVPVMHQENDLHYAEGEGFQAIQLPYLNRDVAMVILLPRAGRFREIEESLTSEWIEGVLIELNEREVILTMPRFSFETPGISLGETLSAMGMPDAFSAGADFSGMDGSVGLTISGVLHRAFIDVNEERTEAAALTIVTVEVGMEIGDEPPIVMKIDRPFIFFIHDIKTDAILFVGRVMNPVSE